MSGETGPEPFEVLAAGRDGEGFRLLVRVPEGTPLCEGHFPGHPIVPGVAHLAWVERALAGHRGGRPTVLQAVRGFRLRKPVHPGEVLELRLTPAGEGSFAFHLKRGDEAVSDGRVEAAGEISAEESRAGAAERSPIAGSLPVRGPARAAVTADRPSLAPSIESLIPHRLPMRLVARVLASDPAAIACEAEVPSANPLARSGRAPGWLALEAAAQAAAALEALGRRDTAPGPRLGYLVGVREATVSLPSLPTAIPFRIALRSQGSAPPLAVYEATADLGSVPVLTATLSTYVPPG